MDYSNATLSPEELIFSTMFTGVMVERHNSKEIIIPCIAFALGVFGNGLAIVTLLLYKYRKVRPRHSALHTASNAIRVRRSTAVDNARPRSRSVSPFGRKDGNDGLSSHNTRRRRSKFGAFHTLVLALISIDFLGIVATSPLTIYLYATNTTIKEAGGEALCNYSAFAMMFVGIVTMSSLTVMAIERVLCIQLPFYYEKKINTKTAKISIVVVLIACIIFSSMPLMGFGKIRSMYPNTWCFSDWDAKELKNMAFNYLYAAIGILLISTTVVCNVFAVIGLVKMKIRMRSSRNHKESMGLEMQTIIQLIVMTLIYLLCWLPLMIRILVHQLTDETVGEHDRIAVWMAAMNPILDPWVFILLRRSVVKRLVKLAKSSCLLKTKTDLEIVIVNPSSVGIDSVDQFLENGRIEEIVTANGSNSSKEQDFLRLPLMIEHRKNSPYKSETKVTTSFKDNSKN